MPNFSIPLSGLTAESTALSAIANNLSNQNTTGYKTKVVLFSDLFYQNLGTSGAGDPIQQGRKLLHHRRARELSAASPRKRVL